MKKLIALILSVSMLFAFAGCMGPSAQEALKENLDILTCKDEDRVIEKYIKGEEIDEKYKEVLGANMSYFKTNGLDKFMLSFFTNIDYKVDNLNEEKDTARGKVTFTTVDLGSAYKEAVKEWGKWAKKNYTKSTSTLTNKLMDIFTKKIDTYAKNKKTKSVQADVMMTKTDGAWKIINTSTMMSKILEDYNDTVKDVNANMSKYIN